VRNPLSGRVEAILDLTCLRDEGDPAVVRLVRRAAHDIEARLLEQATQRERALLAAYRTASRAENGSSTSPRLLRARTEDEGGRGLFLIAQLTDRWGTRYTPDGKIIWAEQPLP
jgi:hypothetical protein